MNKNKEQLDSFINYCDTHPEERFWQAVRNWSDSSFILRAENLNLDTGKFEQIRDTFYE